MCLLRIRFGALAAALLFAAPAGAQLYQVTLLPPMRDLPPGGQIGTGTIGIDMNSRGEVIALDFPITFGDSYLYDTHAQSGFRFNDTFAADGTEVTAINDSGSVAGYQRGLDSNRPERPTAFVYDGTTGIASRLPSLVDQFNSDSAANAISNSGIIVGSSGTTIIRDSVTVVPPFEGPQQAVRWVNGQLEPLGYLENGDWSIAVGVDDAGTVVGRSRKTQSFQDGNTSTFPFVWTEAGGVVELITPAAVGSEPAHVVGIQSTTGTIFGSVVAADNVGTGFLIDRDGIWTLLPRPVPDATTTVIGVNAGGVAVGVASTPGAQFAVVWRDGQGIDLNTVLIEPLAGHLSSAIAINESGQVLVRAFVEVAPGTLEARPVLLTPVAPPACVGDLDGDGDVDVLDFGAFAADFGCTPR